MYLEINFFPPPVETDYSKQDNKEWNFSLPIYFESTPL
jgi:hypothetical protein